MSRSHRANSSLACRHDNSLDYNDYDPCAREEHDAESEFGQSMGSGFTILTDDTQPTSVSSNGSSEGSRGAHPGSFTDQLMKKLQKSSPEQAELKTVLDPQTKKGVGGFLER